MKAEYVDHMGDDLSVVNAARVSFAKVVEEMTDRDVGLIRYLARHNHWTPFAHQRFTFNSAKPILSGVITDPLLTAGMVHNEDFSKVRHSFYGWVNLIERGYVNIDCVGDVQTELHHHMGVSCDAFKVDQLAPEFNCHLVTHETDPLFIDVSLGMSAPVPMARQWFKSKEGAVENEGSRRYISSRPEVFVPSEWRVVADSVKQGSGGVHPKSKDWASAYMYQAEMAVEQYENMIADGVCPEQARFILPQGCEVNWIWTANLTTYARVFNQRTDPHAQKEVRDLANMVGDIVGKLYPESWKSLTEEFK